MDNIQKIFWVVLIITLLTWTGVGIYFLTTRVPPVSKPPVTLYPSPRPTEKPSFKRTFVTTSGMEIHVRYSGHSPDFEEKVEERTVEGTILSWEPGRHLAVASNTETLIFEFDKESYFYCPREIKPKEGAKVRVHYQEKGDEPYIVFLEVMK